MSFESSAYTPSGSLDRTGRFTPTTAQAHASLIEEIERLTVERDQAITEVERLTALALERESHAAKTPMCSRHPAHFVPCTRCHGYDCAACDNTAITIGLRAEIEAGEGWKP